jgi:hypothetical protein
MLMARTVVARSARRVLFASALALAPGLVIAVAPSAADAQTTQRPEFVNGTALTAKDDHAFGNPMRPTKIKAGAKGKVTKVYSSGGSVVFLDIEVEGRKLQKLPVAKIREHYDYVKL